MSAITKDLCEKVADLAELKNNLSSKEMFAIRDEVSGKFNGSPFLASSIAEGERIFGDLCYFGGDSLISRHPMDYRLYYLGTFDTKLGLVNGLEYPEVICSAYEKIEAYKLKYKQQVDNDLDKNSQES